MSDRATCWSVTINNPTADDDENIALAKQRGWRVDGQLEKGENGTVHYQLMVKTPQTRFAALKKAFPRAHIEIARNGTALAKYVKKKDTREGVLPENNQYPNAKAFWKMLFGQYEDITVVTKGLLLMTKDERLQWLDNQSEDLIKDGIMCESFVCNPSTRAAFGKWAVAIALRAIAQIKTEAEDIPNDRDGSDEAEGEEGGNEQEADEDSDGSESDEDSEGGSSEFSEGSGTDEDISSATDSAAD